MIEFSVPSRRTAILSITAIVGIATVYFLLVGRHHKHEKSSRRFRTLQRHIYSQLLKIDDSLQDLVDHDLRLILVRLKALQTHRLFPGDHQVQLPSLGLIHEQHRFDTAFDDNDEVDMIEETKEELIRERTLGYEDPARVRQAYKHLDVLAQLLHEQLERLDERAEAIDLSELAELGDESQQPGDIIDVMTDNKNNVNESDEIQVFERVRRRRRVVLINIRKVILRLERIRSSYQERLLRIKQFEQLERVGMEPTDDVNPTIESEMMKHGVSFAEVAKSNVEEPETLAPTKDLERMKDGVSFAEIAKSNVEEPEVLAPTEDLERMKDGLSFADVTKSNVEEPEGLAPTEDLERMKDGVSFADVAKSNVEEPEVLAPTEDLEKMKHGISFADVVTSHPTEEESTDQNREIPAPTEDLEMMKEGVTFAQVAKSNVGES
ncbi:hypothetical protein BGX28_009385 [Mortierella sp. GBA30]|nr:hypothetical protein BGX28_009385 [Mortierella sp. GBA30]